MEESGSARAKLEEQLVKEEQKTLEATKQIETNTVNQRLETQRIEVTSIVFCAD